jgi:hypothetical protein
VKDKLTEQLSSNLRGQTLERKIAELRSGVKVAIAVPELEPRQAQAPAPQAGGMPPAKP